MKFCHSKHAGIWRPAELKKLHKKKEAKLLQLIFPVFCQPGRKASGF